MIYNRGKMSLDGFADQNVKSGYTNESYLTSPSDEEIDVQNIFNSKDVSYSGSMERFGMQDTSFRLQGKELGHRSDWDDISTTSSVEHIYDVPEDARYPPDYSRRESEL